MDGLGLAHTLLACTALVLGGAVVLRRKGDRFHRTLGHLYVSSMLGVNVTALAIYDLYGRFGPFHGAALLSLATLLAGLLPVLLRRPRANWFELHATFMSWSYVGLLSAATAEAAVRLPAAPFWPAVIGATSLVTLTGALLIHGRGGVRIVRALRRAGVAAAAAVLV
ncbi:MAG: DUF2306 domain-containing protein, partial [Longimicrobiales bacterium]